MQYGRIVGGEQITPNARLALLAVYKLAGGRSGVTVAHDAVAEELGWSGATAVALVASIPLEYAVDAYRGSRLTDAGVKLAEELARRK
jgi:hypothetical protein